MKTTTRFGLVAALAIAGALAPSAANAGPPEVVETKIVQSGIDPCTGMPQEFTLDVQMRTKQNRNNTVMNYKVTDGSSSLGYELIASTRTTVLNPNTVSDRLIEVWGHPDGRKFKVQIVVVIDAKSGTPRVLRVPPETVQCISGPTILPDMPPMP